MWVNKRRLLSVESEIARLQNRVQKLEIDGHYWAPYSYPHHQRPVHPGVTIKSVLDRIVEMMGLDVHVRLAQGPSVDLRRNLIPSDCLYSQPTAASSPAAPPDAARGCTPP